MRTVVLVHGAWHGGWCWDRLVPELRSRDVDPHVVDLPLTTLFEDANAVRAAVAPLVERGHDVTLVGHSYGGAVVTQAGESPGVTGLVYVAAFVPDVGESVSGLAQSEPSGRLGEGLVFADDGTVAVAKASRVPAFYADCPADVAADAAGRLRSMAMAPLVEPVSVAAWRSRPSTYVVCTLDEAVPPELQRTFAGRCSTSVTLEAAHSPFLSQPSALAEVIASAATSI